MSNKNAEKLLDKNGFLNPKGIVSTLIEGGFIEEDPLTEPELLAEGAMKWLRRYGSAHDAFDKASGWSNASWRVVMKESTDREYWFDTPTEVKWIFAALVIMAKEAGVL